MGRNQEVGRFNTRPEQRIMWLKESFAYYWDRAKKWDKRLEVQLFFARLLLPLALTSRPRLCLVFEASALGLTMDLAINGAELIGEEVAIGLSR